MKNYEKPVVMVNEGLAEGVYAASGQPGHWTMNAKAVQKLNGEEIWEVKLVGVTGVVDDDSDKGIKLEIYFDRTIDSVSWNAQGGYAQSVEASGSTVTINWANAWCRHTDSQTIITAISLKPIGAVVMGYSVICYH